MPSLPPDLDSSCATVCEKCPAFNNAELLRAVFTTDELAQLRGRLPSTSEGKRAYITLVKAFLLATEFTDGHGRKRKRTQRRAFTLENPCSTSLTLLRFRGKRGADCYPMQRADNIPRRDPVIKPPRLHQNADARRHAAESAGAVE